MTSLASPESDDRPAALTTTVRVRRDRFPTQAPTNRTGATPCIRDQCVTSADEALGNSRIASVVPWCQTGTVDDAELLRSVLADTTAVATVFDASPDSAVVHCPGWTVADLVAHHGGVLRWAEAIVRTGEPVAEQFPVPTDHREHHRWYLDAADDFVATVTRADRDDACWTFGREPGRIWFWIRRQALEAAVHRWDAELAVGSAIDLAVDIAGAGVTEVVEDLFPRQVALGRTAALSGGVELRAEDVDRRWMLSPSTDGDDLVVEAPVSVLALLLWRRVALDDPRLSVTGPTRMRDELGSARLAP